MQRAGLSVHNIHRMFSQGSKGCLLVETEGPQLQPNKTDIHLKASKQYSRRVASNGGIQLKPDQGRFSQTPNVLQVHGRKQDIS